MTLVTFKGVHFSARPDTTDWNTLNACVTEDEYGLSDEDVAGKLVFDVGAHVGGIGVWLATRGARVVCIEPVPANADMIGINASLNDVGIDVRRAAAGAEASTTTLRFGHEGTDFARHHQYIGNTGVFEEREGFILLTVPTVSLAELIDYYGWPDIIKIDCEGGEWSWLKEPCIKDVRLIVGEWHPMHWGDRAYDRTDVVDAFTHYGRETHRLEFSGPDCGPGGFRAERL